jgi:NAD(P)-dependent dehydrogenase (short-subunit alcohol dehydrogenase family)
MAAAVAAIEAEAGAIAVLVNNAGYQQTGAVESVSLADFRTQFETNVFGAVRLVQLVAPGMRRAGKGRIVNVSSMGGKITLPGGGAYHGTKHALEAISDALRMEIESFGIDVVIIEPGLIRTGFAGAALDSIAAHPEDGPYADFNASIARAYAGMEKPPTAMIVSEPEAVAAAIERALTARRPRTRYRVGISARLFLGLHAILSDRLWDRVVGRIIPLPRPAR